MVGLAPPAARSEWGCGAELLSATMFQGAEAQPAKPSSRWGGGGRSAGRGGRVVRRRGGLGGFLFGDGKCGLRLRAVKGRGGRVRDVASG